MSCRTLNIQGDVKEGQRQNLHHHLVRQLYGNNNYAGVSEEALKRGITVLDVGCGTGIWLAEMNRDFPNGTYYGVDINVSSFAETFRDLAPPGKITLVQGNAFERLPFPDDVFDYVHCQELNQGIPERLWPAVMGEIIRVLKPGSILDLGDIVPITSFHGKPDPVVADFNDKLQKMMMTRGVNMVWPYRLPGFFAEYPELVNPQVARRSAPIGWDGPIGALWLADAKKVYIGAADFVCVALGMTKEEWYDFVEQLCDREVDSKSFMSFVRMTAMKRHR
ncbi:S-adenosyl-L-methionine-dependent methyltransferase [Cladochytrium replicatum]|nr:S-adenosyl-L-methionine-dependent methyltransferase [Cladochytrium replicatum]